jgi:hypothetical protein
MAASAPVFLASTAPLANCFAITVRRLTGWKARPAAVCRLRRPHSFIRSPIR